MTQPIKLLVIGGVAAGASCAARARRLSESAQITVLERGPDVSFANCGLPYHIGGEIQDRSVLAVQTPASLKALLNLDVRTRCEAVRIDRLNKRVEVKNLTSGAMEWITYDKLMLSPGASPIRPNIPGVDDSRIYTLRSLEDMDRIIEATDQGMRAVAIGAGFIGLEMAEQLNDKGLSVELVELQDQVLPQLDKKMSMLLESELKHNEVGVTLGDGIERFVSTEDALECHLKSGKVLKADFVVLSMGVVPDTMIARDAGLSLGARGHIVVNNFQQTSDPDIYAAGDAVETEELVFGGRTVLPMGGPANRQGRIAADHMLRPDIAKAYPGSLGTAIVRVFSVAAGVTGWTEKRMREAGHPCASVIVNDHQHATYYPGAKPLTLKIVWDPQTGRVVGAQATGCKGVDKRLDVLAACIQNEATIDDLCHLELAYAPPFGSAKDIINLAGFAATNLRDGLVIQTDDLSFSGVQIVDVRPKPVADAFPLAGSINIPFPTLRSNLDKLDRRHPVITVCAFGKMSYFAARILAQNGFQVQSYSGGIKGNLDPRSPAKLPTA
jgi:NADPH-dependent 2,4-dienoyl-CoA reductase/sulfur reductase-like enzyme/rhodanese-related sulfurtransferase